MSIERDDLTVQDRDYNDNLTGGWRYLQEGEFERIAQAEGYVKVTEDCETCEGSGDRIEYLPVNPPERIVEPCPDCGGTGKKLRDGVRIRPESVWAVNGHFVIFPAEWLEAE